MVGPDKQDVDLPNRAVGLWRAAAKGAKGMWYEVRERRAVPYE